VSDRGRVVITILAMVRLGRIFDMAALTRNSFASYQIPPAGACVVSTSSASAGGSQVRPNLR